MRALYAFNNMPKSVGSTMARLQICEKPLISVADSSRKTVAVAAMVGPSSHLNSETNLAKGTATAAAAAAAEACSLVAVGKDLDF